MFSILLTKKVKIMMEVNLDVFYTELEKNMKKYDRNYSGFVRTADEISCAERLKKAHEVEELELLTRFGAV